MAISIVAGSHIVWEPWRDIDPITEDVHIEAATAHRLDWIEVIYDIERDRWRLRLCVSGHARAGPMVYHFALLFEAPPLRVQRRQGRSRVRRGGPYDDA